MTEGTDDKQDWVEYQQNEIDGAVDAIKDRRVAVSDSVAHGILQSSYVQEHDNKQIKTYLQGYSDALEFAAREVQQISNYVEYAEAYNEENDE